MCMFVCLYVFFVSFCMFVCMFFVCMFHYFFVILSLCLFKKSSSSKTHASYKLVQKSLRQKNMYFIWSAICNFWIIGWHLCQLSQFSLNVSVLHQLFQFFANSLICSSTFSVFLQLFQFFLNSFSFLQLSQVFLNFLSFSSTFSDYPQLS